MFRKHRAGDGDGTGLWIFTMWAVILAFLAVPVAFIAAAAYTLGYVSH